MKQTIIGGLVTFVVTVVTAVTLWLLEPHVKPTIEMPGEGSSETRPPTRVSEQLSRQPLPTGNTQAQLRAITPKSPPPQPIPESVPKVPEATQIARKSPKNPKPTSTHNAPSLLPHDGQWFSKKFQYGFKVKGDIGIATMSNSPKFAPGDVILRFEQLSEGEFQGEQIFTDGKWRKVSGLLLDADTLKMSGGGHVWIMSRQ